MLDAAPAPARIGPNAVTQLVAPLDAAVGAWAREALLGRAGFERVPGLDAMVDEDRVVRVFAEVAKLPDAAALFREAGHATGRYILANRIPRGAQRLLRVLPGRVSARLLAAAISRHAWTFAGSGRFRVLPGPGLRLEIAANPLAVAPACWWHEAVFETLFQDLAGETYHVREVACCARTAASCRFEVITP